MIDVNKNPRGWALGLFFFNTSKREIDPYKYKVTSE